MRVRARHFHFQTSGNNNHIKCVDACSVTTSTMWNCHGNCDWILANRCYAQQFYSHTHFFLSMLLWIWLTLSITCARVISNIIRSFSLFFFFWRRRCWLFFTIWFLWHHTNNAQKFTFYATVRRLFAVVGVIALLILLYIDIDVFVHVFFFFVCFSRCAQTIKLGQPICVFSVKMFEFEPFGLM